MSKHKLFMETTAVEASRTAQEISHELVSAGATSINTDYKDGKLQGLRWIMCVNGSDLVFDMPARVEPVFKIINGRRSWPTGWAVRDLQQAERVAWRQLLRWVQAQNALISTGMVKPEEVYSPYMIVNGAGQTLFQMLTESKFKMLEAPK